MLAGLEAALTGKQVGDQFTVTLSPDMAYGPRRDDAAQRIDGPVAHLVVGPCLQLGDHAQGYELTRHEDQ